uniref:Ig-like domain-containing protein n=1 Tax=Knipowitschia caucasica TaxID=637954 RepID=A0AAV2L938_KNICA
MWRLLALFLAFSLSITETCAKTVTGAFKSEVARERDGQFITTFRFGGESGLLVCRLTNSALAMEQEARLLLFPEMPPDMDQLSCSQKLARAQFTSQTLSITASSISPLALTPGEALSLLCSVAVDNLPLIGLEITWLSNGRDLITMERNGVVAANGTNYRADASLERVAPGQVRLGVRGVSIEDAGAYACRVRAFVEKGGRSSGGGARWHMAAEKMSTTVNVKVAQIKPGFSLVLDPVATPQLTSEALELSCHVTNITNLPAGGRLGVTWQHGPLPGAGSNPQSSNLIGTLDASGNLVPGSTYSDRLKTGAITLTRVQTNMFKLRFLRTQEVDMGQYSCLVSAWTVNSQGGYVKASEQQSPALPVKWEQKRPTLSVVAKSLREASVGGSTFEMSCTMSTENLGEAGFSVLIQSQDSVGASVKTLMTLSPDSVVQHGGATDPKRRDQLVLLKSSAADFRFRLGGVQLSDRGLYWCDITAWTKQQPGQTWTKATSAESNKIKIDYQENGPSFSIALRSDTTTVFPWDTASMECALSIAGSSPKAASKPSSVFASSSFASICHRSLSAAALKHVLFILTLN